MMGFMMDMYLLGGIVGCGFSFLKRMFLIFIGIKEKEALEKLEINVKRENIRIAVSSVGFIVIGILLQVLRSHM